MLNIFICEDHDIQREQLENCIENYIKIQEWDCKIILSTGNPDDLLNHLRKYPLTRGLFF